MNACLSVYFAPEIEKLSDPLQTSLQAVFLELNIKHGGILTPGKGAFDTYRHQYDVTYLIRQVPSLSAGFLSLWVVAVDLFAPSELFIFGAAGQGKAIVSTYLLQSQLAICSVATHEVGHLLGLSHCNNFCMMQPVHTSEEAEKRLIRLCASCQLKIG